MKLSLLRFLFPFVKKMNKKKKKEGTNKKGKKWKMNQKKKSKNKERKKQWKKGIFNSFPIICGSISIGVWVLVLLMSIWSIVGCSIVFLTIGSTNSKTFVHLFPLPLSPHYNPWKDLLIVICTLHFSGGKFENLDKLMVVVSLDWVLSEPALYFKHINESDSYFPKERLYQSL